ncbi:hypothetical protein AR457_36635 [Streptomyces agglomeratus]|uniref:Uncharacterized protein n=1 Tax=Streptomyces agglomeratus TaxID=285458 RepID=A0A1E5NYH0_9ACTN|nr:hypothetical protein [Streptomyces agglomeratus]OEJ21360.1 hypothetical protein AS594_37875 [Streptomyces agglomeratus]OEJ22790.1 hypothetical protein AR457_36635 [Streptomyces agglomeratus]OEJ36736.1 hypothetical protein BGK72_37020 [Streptomyces agglomeratus]
MSGATARRLALADRALPVAMYGRESHVAALGAVVRVSKVAIDAGSRLVEAIGVLPPGLPGL